MSRDQEPDGRPESTRILIADDNRDAAETLAELLRLFGYRVEAAFNGWQALHIADVMHPNVLVLDIGMPKMDGLELAYHLRRKPWARDALLVAHTGWGTEGDVRRSLAAGFDHHLIKPLDVKALIGLIEHVDLHSRPASVN